MIAQPISNNKESRKISSCTSAHNQAVQFDSYTLLQFAPDLFH